MSARSQQDKRGNAGFSPNILEVTSKGDQTGTVGKFELRQIANVDQTPLPFSFASGETYLFANDKTRVKPMIIFRGKGKRISFREKVLHSINY